MPVKPRLQSLLLPGALAIPPKGCSDRQLQDWLNQPRRVRLRPWWTKVGHGQFRRDDGVELGFGLGPLPSATVIKTIDSVDRSRRLCSQRVRR